MMGEYTDSLTDTFRSNSKMHDEAMMDYFCK